MSLVYTAIEGYALALEHKLITNYGQTNYVYARANFFPIIYKYFICN